MFSWFSARSPVDAAAKCWIETKLGWLAEQFGQECFTRREVILPTPDFFPDAFDGSESSVRRMLNRVCEYMGVDRRYVNLTLYTSPSPLWLVDDKGRYLPPGAAGTFESRSGYCVISLETSQLHDPHGMVGTMAHELAHYRLMSEHRVQGNEFDNELLTDLTVVFHGLGLFLGNCPRSWDSLYGIWPGTDLKKPEYMTLTMYAYALAHAAWWRDERRPPWMKHMNGDLKACFKSSVRFLFETRESSFRPGEFANYINGTL
jgi:hypothetical protein